MSDSPEISEAATIRANADKSNHATGTGSWLKSQLRTKTAVLPVLIIGTAVAVCAILLATRPEIEQAPVEPPVTAIRAIEVESERLTLTVNSRGKVVPATISEVSAAVNGPVAWIAPALVAGGYFAEGEVLVRIDQRDYQTALTKSEAAKQQAEAEANHAAKELERISDLANKRLASDSQLQDARRAAEVSAGRLQNALADFRQAQLNLERTVLRAPFNAIVQARKIELGQNVSPGQSIATLYGADIVEVRLPLANRQLGFLTVSPSFRGTLAPEQAPTVKLIGYYAGEKHTWQGKLVRTEAGIDATNNTVQTVVQVQQPQVPSDGDDESAARLPLPIGLLVQAEISGRTIDDIIALPRHVIRKNTQVLVAAPDDTLQIREVNILRLESDRVLIQGGLKSGERVCISPIQAVVDGMRIRVVEE